MTRTTRSKVLVVGPLPPPVGGVETVTAAVLESAAFSDFEVRHCDLTKGRPKDTQGKFDLGNLWWAAIHFTRMTKSLLSFRPAIVYMPLTATWSGFWRDAVLALMAKISGAMVVGHVHGGWFDRILAAKGLQGRLVRVCLARFDALLMLGTFWKRLIDAYEYGDAVYVVPPTLRRDLVLAAGRAPRHYATADPLGLYVGHVGKDKGVLDLLEALHRLRHEGKNVRMVFVGPPQQQGDWEAIMEKRSRLGLKDLTEFTGPLEGEELFDRFRRSDFLALPSYFEGFPIVYLEAGTFGLPVIGTPVGATTDVLKDEQNALLVQAGNVNQLAVAINRLWSDPETRQRLGHSLQKDVADYHPDAVCRKIADVIWAILGEKPKNVVAKRA